MEMADVAPTARIVNLSRTGLLIEVRLFLGYRSARRRLVGEHAGVKRCGNCTACCGPAALALPEFVAPFERCGHARPKRCGIHKSRPQECRDFACLWTELAQLPTSARPDRAGFFVQRHNRESDVVEVTVFELPKGAVEGELLSLLHFLLDVAFENRLVTRFRVTFRPSGMPGDDPEQRLAVFDRPLSDLRQRVDEGIGSRGIARDMLRAFRETIERV
ncbi:hypothetical protein OAX78_00090 [Planctomycetota bacterium]|nr:hypothetical protein [Planctomycetota bacterium]